MTDPDDEHLLALFQQAADMMPKILERAARMPDLPLKDVAERLVDLIRAINNEPDDQARRNAWITIQAVARSYLDGRSKDSKIEFPQEWLADAKNLR